MEEKNTVILNDHILAPKLAAQLNLPLVKEIPSETQSLLYYQQQKLTLLYRTEPEELVFSVDFLSDSLNYRKQQPQRRESLIKACKIKHHDKLTLIDATCGWGTDAFILANAGFQVTCYEKHPIVAALLADGFQRLEQQYPKLTIKLIAADSTQAIDSADVVYLDPMFPERPKKAKVKKPMQLLQLLTQNQPYAPEALLLEKALQQAQKRVVVKRPNFAPPLANHTPHFCIKSENHRFDVYQK